MKNNNKGFSLPLAMGIVIIISLLAMTILEYIVPFSRDIKGVENSSRAYYSANSGIEEGLYNVYERNNSEVIDNKTEYSDTDFSGNINTIYNTSSSGNVLPPTGEGNSEYDIDWNKISTGNPIQLSIGGGDFDSIADNFNIKFRIPDLDRDGNNNDLTLSGSLSIPVLPIVNWQLSSSNNTLNSSGTIIRVDKIDGSDILLNTFQGVDLNGDETNNQKVGKFYEDNCSGINSGCTIKFSIINKLESDDIIDPITIPYLEWQLDVGGSNIPLRYTKIESTGKSYGFKKELKVKVASQTVNEAFDFTVFQ